MSTDMFPDSFIKHCLENPLEDTIIPDEFKRTGNSLCKNCGLRIHVMAFKGTDYCSDTCKKQAGADVSSVGTHMFVTTSEKRMIDGARNGEGQLGIVSIGKAKRKKS